MHHAHSIDRWDDATGSNLYEHLAGVNDLLLARATFAAAVKRWPGAKITQWRAYHREDVACGRSSGGQAARLGRPLALSTWALRGPRSSDDSETFTHAACLLLRREVLDVSQSRLNCSAACGRSRWSPSSGLAIFRYCFEVFAYCCQERSSAMCRSCHCRSWYRGSRSLVRVETACQGRSIAGGGRWRRQTMVEGFSTLIEGSALAAEAAAVV